VDVKRIYCENEECLARNLKKFVHHVSKKAMNIEGLSESTLEKFFDMGWLNSFADIYRLSDHESEIITMDGFGVKSYTKLMSAIEKSRHTTFERFLIGMDIPLVGSHASAALKKVYENDIFKFRDAVNAKTNFTGINDIGDTINANIHKWFASDANCKLWDDLYALMTFEKTSSLPSASSAAEENPFNGLTIVVTGTLKNFTRETIKKKLLELGAKPSETVSKNTNYVIVGEKAGSKRKKAEELNIKILTEDEFLEMIEG
jgi:DNA ligase (NAD+)